MHTYDLILTGGRVIDGAGAPAWAADVAVRGGFIAAVGNLAAADAARRIDCTGRFVAPGFIDLHTHSDVSVLSNPRMESSVHQGVTTELAGNCGLCVGLATSGPEFGLEKRLAASKRNFDWHDFEGFLNAVGREGCAANFALLAGHGTLRRRVMGGGNRPPAPAEMADMRALLRDCLDAGAFGLSTGLEYPPGKFADTEELIELSREMRGTGAFYTSHLRDEADRLLEAVAEALRVGTEAGVPVELSHHKAEGKRNWGRVTASLAMVDRARAQGLDATCDLYPYPAFMTGLAIRILPPWAQEGTPAQMARQLADPEVRAKALLEIEQAHNDWDLYTIAICRGDRALQGRTVAEAAAAAGQPPAEWTLDLLIREEGFLAAIFHLMDEADVVRVLRWPHSAIGSDAATTAPDGPMGGDQPHPRAYGTFPRVLGRYVRELGVLSWEEAVRRMTSLPAARLRLADRGVIRPGARADLVAFDPETVIDRATYADPHQFPTGIETVIVNGVSVILGGAHTGALPGQVLHRPGSERPDALAPTAGR